MADEHDDRKPDPREEVVALLKEIRDVQKESLDRQNRFLWVSIPIFAVLVIQATLLLFR